jgi:uncharacterized protein (DUF885 family)
MSAMDDLAEDYLRRWAQLEPSLAVFLGLDTPSGGLTDYSPNGLEARADLVRSTLATLSGIELKGDRDRVANESMRERLGAELDLFESEELLREIRPIFSPLETTRMVFDVLPRSTEQDWEELAARMESVPGSLGGYRAALALGIERGVLSARRQALVCAEKAETYAGTASEPGFFRRLASEYSGPSGMLSTRVVAAAKAADAALGEVAHFLEHTYAPAASDTDAVGADRYQLWSRVHNGTDLDLVETYRWGWEELRRIEDEMALTAAAIVPDASLDEVVQLLESDPRRAIEGVDHFIDWLQQLMDTAIADLDGAHFDIPDPVKRIEAMVAPPGSAATMYYTPPSGNFSRPGRTWYPTLGETRFPLWKEATIAYHEGVPGHHLQVGHCFWLGDRLNAFQRFLGHVSAHAEGWALYAERLMAELGYLENPDYRLGMLAGQSMRAARVVLDIGMHLGLRVPEDSGYAPGEVWTAELAQPLLARACRRPGGFVKSEIERYLGMPAQAIGYKVGERAWLDIREKVRRRDGGAFDLKSFHAAAFDLGMVGLDQLERELLP